MAAIADPLQKALTVLLLLASTLVVVGSAEEAPPSSAVYHLELIHVDANGNFTRDELIRRAEHRSRVRAAALSASAASSSNAAAAAATTDGEKYLVHLITLEIGTPPEPFLFVADTGSDVSWVKKGTKLCDRPVTCPPQNDPISTQNANGECVFKKTYGSSNLGASGFMAKETLTLPHRTGGIDITFGCAEKCRDDKGDGDCDRLIPKFADGIVGLNMGRKSLLWQLKVTKFSYCLISSRLNPGLTSPIWLDGGAKLRESDAEVQTTPLVSTGAPDSSVWAYRYYVELEGISISGKDASAPKPPPVKIIPKFEHSSKSGKGLMFVDSGCSFSELESAAFNIIKNLLKEELKTEPVLKGKGKDQQTCFKYTSSVGAEPDIVLNLHLNGAKLPLPWSSYMKPVKKGDEPPEHSCLAITDHGDKISILGNFQQQNIHMLYDLDEKKLSFVPVDDCSKRHL